MRTVLLAIALLLMAPLALCQNPLDATYLPTMDTNCAHSQYAANIWMTDAMAKLRQDAGSPVSNACTLMLHGTQNEFVDFQVHFHDSGGGTANLTVAVSNFVQTAPNSYTINCATLGRCVNYREAYVNVRVPTNGYSSKAWNSFYAPPIVVSGTATSGTSGTSLVCSTCDFIASGVVVGMYAGPPASRYGSVGRVTNVATTTLTLSPGATSIGSGQTFVVYGPAYYPDVLIPAVDPYWGQTTNAWPFTVAANQNQSAWIDVLIPQAAPAGYYSGTVTVKSGTTTLATMPVTIGVWQWPGASYMPSTTTLTMMGAADNWSYEALCTQMYVPGASSTGQAACGNYPGGGGQHDTANRYVYMDAQLVMKDHRWSASAAAPVTGYGNFPAYNALMGPNFNGTCDLHNGAGTTCPILPGSKTTAQTQCFPAYGSGCGGGTSGATTWTAWQQNFLTNGWIPAAGQPILFIQFCDESFCTASNLAIADTQHTYVTPGTPLAATTKLSSIIALGHPNSVDWIVDGVVNPDKGSPEDESVYPPWLAGSTDGIPRKWLAYIACGQSGTCGNLYPGPWPGNLSSFTQMNYAIDGMPVANRVLEWTTYQHGKTGELYYAEELCEYPGYMSQCVPSGTAYDPWNGNYYAGNWGDGSRIYAGSNVPGSVNYMGSGVTIPLILPSLRLKLARDGVQDYEYLNVLTTHGQGAVSMNAANSWISSYSSFNENPSAPQYGFASDLNDARNTVGAAMHSLTYGGGPVNASGSCSENLSTGMLVSTQRSLNANANETLTTNASGFGNHGQNVYACHP